MLFINFKHKINKKCLIVKACYSIQDFLVNCNVLSEVSRVNTRNTTTLKCLLLWRLDLDRQDPRKKRVRESF